MYSKDDIELLKRFDMGIPLEIDYTRYNTSNLTGKMSIAEQYASTASDFFVRCSRIRKTKASELEELKGPQPRNRRLPRVSPTSTQTQEAARYVEDTKSIHKVIKQRRISDAVKALTESDKETDVSLMRMLFENELGFWLDRFREHFFTPNFTPEMFLANPSQLDDVISEASGYRYIRPFVYVLAESIIRQVQEPPKIYRYIAEQKWLSKTDVAVFAGLAEKIALGTDRYTMLLDRFATVMDYFEDETGLNQESDFYDPTTRGHHVLYNAMPDFDFDSYLRKTERKHSDGSVLTEDEVKLFEEDPYRKLCLKYDIGQYRLLNIDDKLISNQSKVAPVNNELDYSFEKMLNCQREDTDT